MLKALFRGFLKGLEDSFPPPPVKPVTRPSRTKMKKYLPYAVKWFLKLHYRRKLFVNGQAYHAMYAFVDGLTYTLTFEYVGKDDTIPKLVTCHNGKPTLQELRREILLAMKDKQQREEEGDGAQKTQEATRPKESVGELYRTPVGLRRRALPLPLAHGSAELYPRRT